MLIRKLSRRCFDVVKDGDSLMLKDMKHLIKYGLRTICCSWIKRRHYSSSSSDILKLHDRGVFQTIFPPENTPELAQKLSSPVTVYCGFDPTADSLHIGNLLAVIGLIHCQRGGHNPICVVGGATAMVGDPSGRTKERQPMNAEEVEKNIISITLSLHRIFDNHQQYIWKNKKTLPEVKILNNADWYKGRSVIDFLSTVGRHFRIGNMLRKHSVQSRINSGEGMSFTEFTYPIFQAYDWYQLLKNYNCILQIGGNDQLGNLGAGYEFIQQVNGQNVFGLTVPIVTSTMGDKLGKSAGNAVWLNLDKTSPYELYQYIINFPDSDVEKYLKLFTFLPDTEIKDVMNKQKVSANERPGQKKIAEEMIKLVHGESGLEEARRWTKALFSGDINDLAQLDQYELKKLFKNATNIKLFYEPGMTVFDICMKAKCFNREVDAERIIKEGGVSMNHRQVKEPDYVLLAGEHILPNNITLIRVGKKNYYIVEWVTS